MSPTLVEEELRADAMLATQDYVDAPGGILDGMQSEIEEKITA